MVRAFLLGLFIVSLSAVAESEEERLDPDRHENRRLTTELGIQEHLGPFLAGQFRLALHDFTDPLKGYPPDTRLDIASIKVRVHTRKPKFWLDEATVIRFERLPPLGQSHELSWMVELLAETVRDQNCDYCIAGVSRGYLGVSGEISPEFGYFILWGLEASFTEKYQRAGTKLGSGPRAGLRVTLTDSFRMTALVDYRRLLWSNFPNRWMAGLEARAVLISQLALVLRTTGFADGWEAATGLSLYF